LFNQVKIPVGRVLKTLVAVEVQLCSDFLFLHSIFNSIKDKVNRLLCPGLVCDNTIIIEISDHGQIQDTLASMDVGYIRNPFCIWFICLEIAIEQIFKFMYLLPHNFVFSSSTNFG